MTKLQRAILRTLAYADIFDYPLTLEEIHRFLIGQKVTKSKLKTILNSPFQRNPAKWAFSIPNSRSGFYFLRGRENIVATRKKREKWSKKKLKLARRTANWLKLIPTIKMVAVTGALAMENSEGEDDIDLLIVAAKNRLWFSRGLVVTFLRFFGLYRRPRKIKNMVCPNMLLDEKHLVVPKKEQDLFAAHEACQLKVLWEKGGIYQKFVKENQWAKRFLPNWKP